MYVMRIFIEYILNIHNDCLCSEETKTVIGICLVHVHVPCHTRCNALCRILDICLEVATAKDMYMY